MVSERERERERERNISVSTIEILSIYLYGQYTSINACSPIDSVLCLLQSSVQVGFIDRGFIDR